MYEVKDERSFCQVGPCLNGNEIKSSPRQNVTPNLLINNANTGITFRSGATIGDNNFSRWSKWILAGVFQNLLQIMAIEQMNNGNTRRHNLQNYVAVFVVKI